MGIPDILGRACVDVSKVAHRRNIFLDSGRSNIIAVYHQNGCALVTFASNKLQLLSCRLSWDRCLSSDGAPFD